MTKRKKLKTITLSAILATSVSLSIGANNTAYAFSKSKSVSNNRVISYTKYRVKVNKAKVKIKASSTSKTTATLSKGKEIDVVYSKNGWSEIRYNTNKKGWIQNKNIEKSYVSKGRQVVISANTQLKESNNSSSKSLIQLKKGAVVFYTGTKKNGWLKVEDGHYCGWVLDKYTK